jgi:hypothetical protein
MDYHAKFAASLAATQARLGDTCPMITWAGKDYAILPGSAMRRKELGVGGFDPNADLKFQAHLALFLTDTIANAMALEAAMLQTEVGYLGHRYKAISMRVMPGQLIIEVECNALSQRA